MMKYDVNATIQLNNDTTQQPNVSIEATRDRTRGLLCDRKYHVMSFIRLIILSLISFCVARIMHTLRSRACLFNFSIQERTGQESTC